MDQQYKLYYFVERGITEPIRLLLHYVGQEFEDVRFNDEQWAKEKGSELTPHPTHRQLSNQFPFRVLLWANPSAGTCGR